MTYRTEMRWIVVVSYVVLGTALATPAQARPAMAADYVSVGDSYAAVGSLPATSSDTCRASDNVGHLVAHRMPGVSFIDAACRGADTADLVASPSQGVGGLGPRTKYVSVSIGGNDGNVFTDLAPCLLQVTCTPALRVSLENRLTGLPARLDRAYAAIRAAAPSARVVVAAYLRIAPATAAHCFVAATTGQRVVDFVNHLFARINTDIAAAADRAGFIVVNHDQDDRHSICAADGVRYVSATGIGPGDAGTPFHPTAAGRRYLADLITDAFRPPAVAPPATDSHSTRIAPSRRPNNRRTQAAAVTPVSSGPLYDDAAEADRDTQATTRAAHADPVR